MSKKSKERLDKERYAAMLRDLDKTEQREQNYINAAGTIAERFDRAIDIEIEYSNNE